MLKAFGAFVRIEGFRKEGLVHISQLVNGRRVETPDEVVTPGDEVKVVVLSTDNGRLSVSMRQVDQATGEVVGDSRGTVDTYRIAGLESLLSTASEADREGLALGHDWRELLMRSSRHWATTWAG